MSTITSTISELQALSARLKDAQRRLIEGAAKSGALPADGTLRRLADLEGAINAVDLLIEERGGH